MNTGSTGALMSLSVALACALALSAGALICGCAHQGADASQPRAIAELQPGLRMTYDYPGPGARFEVTVHAASELEFRAVAGPVSGLAARVTYTATHISNGITLLTWGEENGAQMVMVVDLVGLRVHAREVRDGKLLALEGTIAVTHVPR